MREDPPGSIRMALACYDGLWCCAMPLLGRNPRLREGLDQRLGRRLPEGPFDLWIQAASAGEAYLAQLLLDHVASNIPRRILITSNTRQGKDLIDAAIEHHRASTTANRMVSAFFPFDRPSLMRQVLSTLKPRLVVLLETEIWPGLLSVVKADQIPVIILNGRMQAKSLRHYRIWPRLWQALAPDRILAVSAEDAERYARLFGRQRVSIMSNMKFDRIRTASAGSGPNPVAKLVSPNTSLVVLGSVRREEEDAVARMIRRLRHRCHGVTIGLFPRHMHRIAAWQQRLAAAGIPYRLRSETRSAVEPGTVLLWDVFGELTRAYAIADAAFVGGSLAPLGGQNFLEPLSCGVIPTIGPSRETFQWVGEGLFHEQLVRVAQDEHQAADFLLATLDSPTPRTQVQQALDHYVAARRGGTAAAAALVERFLDGSISASGDSGPQGTSTP